MKEKRYFCDYWYLPDGHETLITIRSVILSLIAIVLVGSIISYNVLISKYENELNSYSESEYKYLDEIADDVIQEGIGIDLLALPNDVVKYEITSENGKVIFKYDLDNNINRLFNSSANMTIELSEDFAIISKEPNYSSEEEYVSAVKGDMIFSSVMIAGIIWIMLTLAGMFVCSIVAKISEINKMKQ